MVFRYPGSKTKLLPEIKKHLDPLLGKAKVFHDVFVGGGSVLIQVAKDYPRLELFANDLDKNISAFWQLMGSGSVRELNQLLKLIDIRPTIQHFKRLRSKKPKTRVMKAYYAVFFNRCTFSGIARSGPIGGYHQKSEYTVDCRYNPKRLKEEIIEIRKLLHGRLTVGNFSFSVYFVKVTKPKEVLYLDPPYYKKGPMLYTHSMKHKEHEEMAEFLRKRKNWVLSYDICPEINALYTWANRHEIKTKYSVKEIKKEDRKIGAEYIITP